jgi:hypothetical protein
MGILFAASSTKPSLNFSNTHYRPKSSIAILIAKIAKSAASKPDIENLSTNFQIKMTFCLPLPQLNRC